MVLCIDVIKNNRKYAHNIMSNMYNFIEQKTNTNSEFRGDTKCFFRPGFKVTNMDNGVKFSSLSEDRCGLRFAIFFDENEVKIICDELKKIIDLIVQT